MNTIDGIDNVIRLENDNKVFYVLIHNNYNILRCPSVFSQNIPKFLEKQINNMKKNNKYLFMIPEYNGDISNLIDKKTYYIYQYHSFFSKFPKQQNISYYGFNELFQNILSVDSSINSFYQNAKISFNNFSLLLVINEHLNMINNILSSLINTYEDNFTSSEYPELYEIYDIYPEKSKIKKIHQSKLKKVIDKLKNAIKLIEKLKSDNLESYRDIINKVNKLNYYSGEFFDNNNGYGRYTYEIPYNYFNPKVVKTIDFFNEIFVNIMIQINKLKVMKLLRDFYNNDYSNSILIGNDTFSFIFIYDLIHNYNSKITNVYYSNYDLDKSMKIIKNMKSIDLVSLQKMFLKKELNQCLDYNDFKDGFI